MGQMPRHIVQVRHEALVADREGELRRILGELKLPRYRRRIQEIAARETGKMRPAYDGSGIRVEVGSAEWPLHFGPLAARLLDDHCGDLMRELGYGRESEWTALLERAT